jgi:hypothetical protein
MLPFLSLLIGREVTQEEVQAQIDGCKPSLEAVEATGVVVACVAFFWIVNSYLEEAPDDSPKSDQAISESPTPEVDEAPPLQSSDSYSDDNLLEAFFALFTALLGRLDGG